MIFAIPAQPPHCNKSGSTTICGRQVLSTTYVNNFFMKKCVTFFMKKAITK